MHTRLSASVSLLRPYKNSFELLMLKRQNYISFGGAHSYPGGVLEVSDGSDQWLSHLSIGREFLEETRYSKKTDLSMLKIGAIRETLEETGVFLGSGDPVSRPKSAREFLDSCLQYKSYPSVDKLRFLARFITPEVLRKRYDAVFFMAMANDSMKIDIDARESQGYVWGHPSFFLREFKKGNILLYPPQLYMMCILAQFSCIESLFNFNFPRVPLLGQISSKDNSLFYPGDFRHKYTLEEERESICVHELNMTDVGLRIDHRLPFNFHLA